MRGASSSNFFSGVCNSAHDHERPQDAHGAALPCQWWSVVVALARLAFWKLSGQLEACDVAAVDGVAAVNVGTITRFVTRFSASDSGPCR